MKYCPQIYKGVPDGHVRFADLFINYDSVTIEKMETCCNLNLQCDVQKRLELNKTLIDANIRHCECENKFRDCITAANWRRVANMGDNYFRTTAKCYSVDHPIIKCEEFKCFYQPKKSYKQFPSGHMDGAVRCVKYQLDKTKAKIYQTFELPFYYYGYFDWQFEELEGEAYRDEPDYDNVTEPPKKEPDHDYHKELEDYINNFHL